MKRGAVEHNIESEKPEPSQSSAVYICSMVLEEKSLLK
jgi:hypothetical protein